MTCGANVPLPPKPHTEVNPAGSSNQLIGTPAPREKADRKLLGTSSSSKYPTVNGRYGKGTMKIDPSFSGWETMAVSIQSSVAGGELWLLEAPASSSIFQLT